VSLSTQASQAIAEFSACGSWEARARLLLQWGERLQPLTEAERSTANLVQGCESQVWLVADCLSPTLMFRSGSDARLVRGLLALLLARVNGLSVRELQCLDLGDWFARLGLARQLSPSRSNGLNAVLKRMQELTA
jgi:cysteine desulfuration protein SufE